MHSALYLKSGLVDGMKQAALLLLIAGVSRAAVLHIDNSNTSGTAHYPCATRQPGIAAAAGGGPAADNGAPGPPHVQLINCIFWVNRDGV